MDQMKATQTIEGLKRPLNVPHTYVPSGQYRQYVHRDTGHMELQQAVHSPSGGPTYWIKVPVVMETEAEYKLRTNTR